MREPTVYNWLAATLCYFPVASGFCVLSDKSINQSITISVFFSHFFKDFDIYLFFFHWSYLIVERAVGSWRYNSENPMLGPGDGRMEAAAERAAAQVDPRRHRDRRPQWEWIGIADSENADSNLRMLPQQVTKKNTKVQQRLPPTRVFTFFIISLHRFFFITESPHYLLMILENEIWNSKSRGFSKFKENDSHLLWLFSRLLFWIPSYLGLFSLFSNHKKVANKKKWIF